MSSAALPMVAGGFWEWERSGACIAGWKAHGWVEGKFALGAQPTAANRCPLNPSERHNQMHTVLPPPYLQLEFVLLDLEARSRAHQRGDLAQLFRPLHSACHHRGDMAGRQRGTLWLQLGVSPTAGAASRAQPDARQCTLPSVPSLCLSTYRCWRSPVW